MPKLYIVATPIGNLEDITLRALRVLKEADMILCEDTRVTRNLLKHYDIKTPTMSYHAHSKLSRVEKIFELLRKGKDMALVSDAGTPTISDPGVLLVQQVRGEFGDEVAIIAIPGPSALISALSVGGISSAQFTFYGFLPHKKGRETIFKEIAASKRTSVFYESPHRIIKTLDSLERYLTGNRKMAVARELTKIHEENVSGSIGEIRAYFNDNPDKVRGEFVVIIAGVA
jgi:16S rRNA (cytidine1402-2'-O)-methyltransferase